MVSMVAARGTVQPNMKEENNEEGSFHTSVLALDALVIGSIYGGTVIGAPPPQKLVVQSLWTRCQVAALSTTPLGILSNRLTLALGMLA